MTPYKIDIDKKKLPKKLDRRIKLNKEDKIYIKSMINKWSSDSYIATMFNVHRKTIYLLRNPIQAQKEKEAYKLRRLDGRYYNKDKATISVRDTRRHRQKNKDLLIK